MSSWNAITITEALLKESFGGIGYRFEVSCLGDQATYVIRDVGRGLTAAAVSVREVWTDLVGQGEQALRRRLLRAVLDYVHLIEIFEGRMPRVWS